jgi:hypothetical protein
MKIVNETTWGARREDAAGEEKHAFPARPFKCSTHSYKEVQAEDLIKSKGRNPLTKPPCQTICWSYFFKLSPRRLPTLSVSKKLYKP